MIRTSVFLPCGKICRVSDACMKCLAHPRNLVPGVVTRWLKKLQLLRCSVRVLKKHPFAAHPQSATTTIVIIDCYSPDRIITETRICYFRLSHWLSRETIFTYRIVFDCPLNRLSASYGKLIAEAKAALHAARSILDYGD